MSEELQRVSPVDALTGRETAEQIFMLAANQTEDMCITASSATDISYSMRKYLYNTEKAKNALRKLYELFYILDVTADDCQNALASAVKDYENAVISCCAAGNKMDYIVTRNIKDYEHSNIKAIQPDDFMRLVLNEEE